MSKYDQFSNPYAPPVSRVEVEVVAVAALADVEKPDEVPDELQDDLIGAFYAATYGTVFLPGLAYCVALFLLMKAYMRRAEFSPQHHRSFTITAVICLILSPLALAAVLGVIVFLGHLVR